VFKSAKQVKIFKHNGLGEKIITIANSKDKIILKAISIILELIYEKNGYFHDESHGFRHNKSFHTALNQIKST